MYIHVQCTWAWACSQNEKNITMYSLRDKNLCHKNDCINALVHSDCSTYATYNLNREWIEPYMRFLFLDLLLSWFWLVSDIEHFQFVNKKIMKLLFVDGNTFALTVSVKQKKIHDNFVQV